MPKGYGFKSMFSVKSAGGIKKGKKKCSERKFRNITNHGRFKILNICKSNFKKFYLVIVEEILFLQQ